MQQDTFVKERTALAVQPEQGEDTIDLLELFMGLLAHWTLIAATAVVGAVLMALYTFFLVTPMYKATATIYVVSRNDSVLNFSDLQVGSELTSDYIKVFFNGNEKDFTTKHADRASIDFIMHVRSGVNDGIIEVWMNGDKVAVRQGNCYDGKPFNGVWLKT